MNRFDASCSARASHLLSKFAGSRYGVCGVIGAMRLGDVSRLIASHGSDVARFQLLIVLIAELFSNPSDAGFQDAVDQVWNWIARDDWSSARSHLDVNGAVIGFTQAAVRSTDWDDDAAIAVLASDVAAREVAVAGGGARD